MRRPAFTLIELLIVLAIISLLVSAVYRMMQPTTQLESAYSTSRRNAELQIASAVSQFMIDTRLITDFPTSKGTAIDICLDTVVGTSCTNSPVSGYDLSIVVPDFLTALPVDPQETSGTVTGFRIYKENSFIRVCSKWDVLGCGN